MKVVIIVPVHNEQQRIEDSVCGMIQLIDNAALEGFLTTCHVYFIDDHSDDKTVETLIMALQSHRNSTSSQSSHHLDICQFSLITREQIATYTGIQQIPSTAQKVLGKGGALNCAVPVVDRDAAVYLLADGDLGQSFATLISLVKEVAFSKTDMAIGAFKSSPSQRGGFGFVKRAALKGIRRLTGAKCPNLQSPLSGQRALSNRAFFALTPFAEGFGVEVALTIKACWLKLTFCEIELDLSHRYTTNNISGILHRLRQYLDVQKTLRQLARVRNDYHGNGG